MKSEIEKFVKFFKTSNLWKNMEKTTEGSPWHREASVAIHTEMVLEEYNKIASSNDNHYMLGFMSLLFHDTGKPACMKEKFKPERGNYFAFHGHELYSARLWEDFYVENRDKHLSFVSVEDAYKIMWMIENHLPYDYIHNSRKMDELYTAIHHNLNVPPEIFGHHLLGDSYGRISDDQESKRKKTHDFVEVMCSASEIPARYIKEDAPTLVMLIGASGSGKSSYVKKHLKDFTYYSFDELRVQLFFEKRVLEYMKELKKSTAEVYEAAWNYCDTHRSEFGHYSDVEFIKILKKYENVVVDNTNVSKKHRVKFIAEAKKRGYNVKAVMFPASLEQVLARQYSRTDKTVPSDAVERQYFAISVPWVGVEVDALEFYTGNFNK